MVKIKYLIAALCLLLSSCSYLAEFTSKFGETVSSFSIDASYDSMTEKLTVSWKEVPSEDGFAGYEVYISERRWDEFGTFVVIAAKVLTPPLSSRSYFTQISSLGIKTTKSVVLTISPLQLNGPGEYYVKVAVIQYKYDSDTKTYDTTYSKSSISAISGNEAVYLD